MQMIAQATDASICGAGIDQLPMGKKDQPRLVVGFAKAGGWFLRTRGEGLNP